VTAPSDGDARSTGLTAGEAAVVSAQLGRPARGVHSVAHRCRCRLPDVVRTAPRLPDGTPFPTLYYLTCPRSNGAIGTLEAAGLMGDLTETLTQDAELAGRYRAAHESYLADRDAISGGLRLDVPEIAGVSAGGMPDRVKCLHALAAHSLASGPGVNPIGDEVLRLIPDVSTWREACVEIDATVTEAEA
jgi:hypothetical protein